MSSAFCSNSWLNEPIAELLTSTPDTRIGSPDTPTIDTSGNVIIEQPLIIVCKSLDVRSNVVTISSSGNAIDLPVGGVTITDSSE